MSEPKRKKLNQVTGSLRPCPFCGDPMRINNAKLITHSDRSTACIIGDLVWDESNAEKWNIRENH